MKKFLLSLAVLFAGYVQAQDAVLFSIDDEQITANEFKAVYLKNRDIGKNIDPKTPSEYLDLYVKFKLKVKEAVDMGNDTMPTFEREFTNYRNQLAKPYLEDRSVDSALVTEAYQRMQQEVRASHIMLDLPMGALPEDTAAAYERLMNLRAQIIKGTVTFENQAKKFSTDQGSAQKGGDLGYFTVFDMVYPFETAAYTTPVGEISKPVRSQFGYHIVKVTDKRPSRGTVQVRHIFLISNEKTDEAKAASAEQRINEIYALLQEGEDFEKLVRQFSDDKNTKEKGGLLQPFGINKMLPEFEEQSFALQTKGQYSEPFRTDIGWHIVMLEEKQGVPPFEDVEEYIKQKISKDSRSAKSKEVFLAKLKKEYNLKENPKRLAEIYKVVDESYLDGLWNPENAAKLKKTLFTLDGVDHNQQEFVAFLDNQQKRGSKPSTNIQQLVYMAYNRFVDQTVMNYENSRLEEKYPDFKLLVNEYRDGILLFDLTQEKVWNKASQDSVGLYEFYEAHKANYMWPQRVEANVLNCANEKVAKKAAKMLSKGATVLEVEAKFNVESSLEIVSETGKYPKGANPMVDQAKWEKGEVSVLGPVDDRFTIVQIIDVLPAQNKELLEARGMIISDYQKKLEEDWLIELHQKYTVTIDQDVFRALNEELN